MNEPTLQGHLITLVPTTIDDRRTIYEWLAHSDVTRSMMGMPLFPDSPVPTWEEFCEDHMPHFFDGSAPLLGRSFMIVAGEDAAGQIYYNEIKERRGAKRVEIDMWMRAEKYCGRGYGGDALATLCDYLRDRLGVNEVMMQPSARNPRAIQAYGKIGFIRLPGTLEENGAEWGQNDYDDSVYMVKSLKNFP